MPVQTPTALLNTNNNLQTNTSFLSYASSNQFRENLILLNLQPYNIDGINPEQAGSVTYIQTLPDLANPEVLFSLDNPNYFPIFRNDNPEAKIIPSTYTAYDILTTTYPTGSNGSITQDSYLAKIGSQVLKSLLSDTNAKYLELQVQSENSVTFNITTPDVNETFESKLQGSYFPKSTIPGDYFLDGINARPTDTLGEVINLAAGRSTRLGGVLNGTLSRAFSPSQLFLQNTSDGQKGILFSNLSYNIFRPAYADSTLGGLAGNLLTTFANNLLDNFGLQLPGAFYVGSVTSDPLFAASPINAVPIDVFGRATGAPVFGPDVLAKDYEGNEGKLNFGLQNKNIIDQGNVESNFIWVSPKYKEGNEEYYSTNIDFKPGSILDDTQRLINAADNLQGDSRLRHVGTAMNQISKIFNDGYKKITKGSKVATYKDSLFEKIIGEEYCRVFTKVDAYTTYDKLQKPEGIVTYGRRFDNSVLDNTYNLNIAPLKGENSTNILKEDSVKKYMFSLENLAWASNNDLFNDLPACEKGPNGGRIMWFPPYALTFNDNSSANWNETAFLGRPEPVYTYKNSSRNGTISWKIVVDHPSVLNVIVNKVLSNETPFNANRALEAFFAGCQKYDLYDLASKYSTIDRNSLQEIQKVVKTTPAVYKDFEKIVPKNIVTTESVDRVENIQGQTANLSSFVGLGFYFDNNKPGPNTGESTSEKFDTLYDTYFAKQTEYKQNALNDKDSVSSFFENVLKDNFDIIKGDFFNQVYEAINNGNEIIINFEGSASASASDAYNLKLAKRRISSVQNFLENYSKGSSGDTRTLKGFLENNQLKITSSPVGESAKNVTPKSKDGIFAEVANCTTNPTINSGPNKGKKMTDTQAIYTTESMACRSVRIKEIIVTPPKPTQKKTTETISRTQTFDEVIKERELVTAASTEETTKVLDKPGLSKRVLRHLLNECDYFEVLKETDPFIFDELRKKLKFFSPTFHSITPEGLNSRLTFLNQCMRPGRTIPVIGTDGEQKFDDSLNTAFGAPPVLVLRIGDFFNTKIIPKTLGITFDNGNGIQYDMNPEGIGLQPMVATIQLVFDFIGGNGLANPVDELQNALSFNYYANTEIYDERATPTENVDDLNVLIDFSKRIPPEQTPPVIENIPQNSQGKTIGNVVSNLLGKSTQTFSETEETGELSYRDLMSSILDQSKDYFSSVINKSTSISESYNSIITLLSTSKRKYQSGVVGSGSTSLFGYSYDVQNQVNKLIDDVKTDINNNDNTILKFFIEKGFLSDGPVIETIKTNLTNFIDNLKQDFVNGIVQELDFVNTQQINLISSIDQMNVVYSTIDGKVTNKGDVIVYDISGSSSGDLYSDYDLLSSEYNQFLSFMYSQGLITDPLTPFNITTYSFEILLQDWEKRFFALMCHIIIDKNKSEQFKNALLPDGDVISGNEITKPKRPVRVLDTVLGLRAYQEINFSLGSDMHDTYSREKRRQNRKYINLPVTSAVKYNKYTKFFNPYNKLSNKRILNYVSKSSPTDVEKNKILNLWSTQYNGDNDSFNGKKKFI